jgi:hypothetical protein
VAGYQCRYDAATTDSPDLFTALWTAPRRPARLAVANLSRQPVKAAVSVRGADVAPAALMVSQGASVAGKAGGIDVDLPAAGYLLVGGQ